MKFYCNQREFTEAYHSHNQNTTEMKDMILSIFSCFVHFDDDTTPRAILCLKGLFQSKSYSPPKLNKYLVNNVHMLQQYWMKFYCNQREFTEAFYSHKQTATEMKDTKLNIFSCFVHFYDEAKSHFMLSKAFLILNTTHPPS